jgi:hypothetical protein
VLADALVAVEVAMHAGSHPSTVIRVAWKMVQDCAIPAI